MNVLLDEMRKLREKELVDGDGKEYQVGLVRVEDAMKALENLEVRILQEYERRNRNYSY